MSANLMSLASSGGKFLKLYGDRKMMKSLPYDAEVEWLECDGNQYIDSMIVPSIYSHPYAKVSLMPLSPYTRPILFGAFGGGRFNIYINNAFQIGLGDRIISFANFQNTADKICEVEIDSSSASASLTYNGNTITRSGYTYVPCTSSLWFFGRNYQAGDKSARMRLYNSVFRDGSELIADFACVRIGDEGAMYDRVSGQLFRNQGTGAFIIGPDKTI